MPAIQRGQVDRIAPGKWRLRYYLPDGSRKSKQPFPSRSAAWTWYRENAEPQLGAPTVDRDVTLSGFIPLYLERHGATGVRPRTISTLRERLVRAERAFGNIPLSDLERMAGEIATWQAKLPERSRHGVVGALRQLLGAAVRWEYISKNPAVLAGRNRQPAPRTVRVYTNTELHAIARELAPTYAPLPSFGAATGLRPEEWQALERRDIDRGAGVINVRRTVSSREVVELGKTSRSRRQVPLSPRALSALDALPPRLDTPLVFPAPEGGLLNANNFANREWRPAIEAAAINRPARIYDMRHTFASNSLAAGISLFELARIMGTSVLMIERVYGSLLEGATESIARRLAAFERAQSR